MLRKFHLSCKNEYKELLNNFNILFYGYGSKKRMLKEIFPNSILINCNFYNLKDIIELINVKLNLKEKSILEIDKMIKNCNIRERDLLYDPSGKITIILLNFNFKLRCYFKKLKNIKLIFTLEKIDEPIDSNDLVDLNIAFRDLTTYELYEEDIIDIEINDNKYNLIMKVINNVPKNSRYILKELLRFDKPTVDISELFDKVKIKLMIVSKNILFTLLTEFVDHKLIKIKDKKMIHIEILKKYYKDIIKNIN